MLVSSCHHCSLLVRNVKKKVKRLSHQTADLLSIFLWVKSFMCCIFGYSNDLKMPLVASVLANNCSYMIDF